VIAISAVIPTHDRVLALQRCLTSLSEQTLDRTRYEVLVIDDASSDETPALLQRFSGVRTFRQPRNLGPAAARNVGIRAARGRYVLFLDDDVVLPGTLLAQHLAAHDEVPGEHVAILGKAVWPSTEPMSPLMRCWEARPDGSGYIYDHMPDPYDVSYRWFITRHVSVVHSFLTRHGVFDEDFPYAYGEDTELGYRLQRQGLRIVYRPDIVLKHHHQLSYPESRRLRRRAGKVALLMARKHPELADLTFAHLRRKQRATNWIKRWSTEVVLDPLLVWADQRRLDHPLLARAYAWALHGHQTWALHDALRGPSPSPAAGRDDDHRERHHR
jgi:GT2 family glycosyltransferase